MQEENEVLENETFDSEKPSNQLERQIEEIFGINTKQPPISLEELNEILSKANTDGI
ncbi:hypothetical protein [Nostoc sp. MS1]|uniref:hypothetical protein n=1 Tax=Nostoc sp. MS1 TaxID=2764711 RepID=UPI001CC74A99|nr:hypothetical protein [Nostoc sp. MS1]BCL39783.1 hypothetical protein NSMS1_62300 [Nostoc sp. MS1]